MKAAINLYLKYYISCEACSAVFTNNKNLNSCNLLKIFISKEPQEIAMINLLNFFQILNYWKTEEKIYRTRLLLYENFQVIQMHSHKNLETDGLLWLKV